MVKMIDDKFYSLDTPAERTKYTIALMKHNKAQKERKREKDADSVTNRLRGRYIKRGQM